MAGYLKCLGIESEMTLAALDPSFDKAIHTSVNATLISR